MLAAVTAVSSPQRTSGGIRYRLDPRWVDRYAERADVAATIRRLRKVTEDDDVAAACDQYLTELEMLDQGKDPDVRFDRD